MASSEQKLKDLVASGQIPEALRPSDKEDQDLTDIANKQKAETGLDKLYNIGKLDMPKNEDQQFSDGVDQTMADREVDKEQQKAASPSEPSNDDTEKEFAAFLAKHSPSKDVQESDDDKDVETNPVDRKTPIATPEDLEKLANGTTIAPNTPDNSDVSTQSIPQVSPPAPVNPLQTLKDQFDAAQAQQRDAQGGANIMRIGNQIGAALGRTSPHVLQQLNQNADAMERSGGNAMNEIQQKVAFQAQDPQSGYSKAAREFLSSHFGVKLPDDMSAAQLDKTFMAPALKSFEADATRAANMAKLQQQTQSKQDLAKQQIYARKQNVQDQIDSREFIAGENAKTRAAAKQEADATKATHQQDQFASQIEQRLGSSRLPPDIRQAKLDMYAAGKAQRLMSEFENPSPQMIALLKGEISKIASGGRPTASELQHLDEGTLSGALAGVWQKFSNEPTGANAQAFLKQYMQYTNGLAANAKTMVDKYVKDTLEPAKHRIGQDNYNSIKERFYDQEPSGAPGLVELGKGISFPRQVKKDGKVATVSNDQELHEANSEGWQ